MYILIFLLTFVKRDGRDDQGETDDRSRARGPAVPLRRFPPCRTHVVRNACQTSSSSRSSRSRSTVLPNRCWSWTRRLFRRLRRRTWLPATCWPKRRYLSTVWAVMFFQRRARSFMLLTIPGAVPRTLSSHPKHYRTCNFATRDLKPSIELDWGVKTFYGFVRYVTMPDLYVSRFRERVITTCRHFRKLE